MWCQEAVCLKLDGKDKTLAVFNLPAVHTLDADGLSTQLVGYFLSNSLTAVVHDVPTKAGLQTFLHLKAPSRANTQWLSCFKAIMEFTAAGQSEILTHIPN